ncbi:MAG: outer membrane beta-barrel protein [Magnetococcales bacterium]|nr:outer membrane beta-barrel protein [Magnetococcales bacterium]
MSSIRSPLQTKIASSLIAIILTICFIAINRASAVGLAPEGFRKGSITFFPAISVSETYNDNIYLEPDTSNNKTDSWINNVAPRLKAKIEFGKHDLSMSYSSAFGTYHSSPKDNYNDHSIGSSLKLNLSRRLGLDINVGKKWGHDAKGSNDAIDSTNPNEHINNSFGINIIAGNNDSRGRLEIGTKYYDLDYVNNPATTVNLEHSNLTSNATFFWQIMPKTSLLTGIDIKDYNYSSAGTTLDSTNIFYYGGFNWELTGKTECKVKLGYTEKKYDDNTKNNFSGLSWDASASWAPLLHSKFILKTVSSIHESTGLGDYIAKKDLSLKWDHNWSDVLFTKTSATIVELDYKGDGSNREDGNYIFGANVGYKFNRWGLVILGYDYIERSSNVNTNDYELNKFMLKYTLEM